MVLGVALGGCGGNKLSFNPPSRDIGAAPAYLAPVDDVVPQTKQSPVVVADQRRAIVEKQNAIIVCTHAEWDATRAAMLNGERPADAVEQDKCPLLDQVKPAAEKKKRRRWFHKAKEA